MQNNPINRQRQMEFSDEELKLLANCINCTIGEFEVGDNCKAEHALLDKITQHLEKQATENAPCEPEHTALERRKSGERYCPKCFSFGHDHRKSCPYAGQGMKYHIQEK